MLTRRLAPLLVLAPLLAGCRGDGSVPCGKLDPRNGDEIALCNELDQAVIARVAMPEGEPPSAGWPGVVVLHGSGGMFRSESGEYPCSEEVHDQFRIWAELLTDRGYAVIMPASFYSRGFCDWYDEKSVPPKLDDHERLVVRTFDATAAANWLCDDPRVDCSRLAVLGFSNGASTAMMLLHEDLGEAEDPRLRGLTSIPSFAGGVAYYPGCGLEGELSDRVDPTNLDRYYFPHAPLWVPHASEDSLLDRCEQLRDVQVDAVAETRDIVEDRFELTVYPGAEHGFDVWFTGDPQADLDARTAAQAEALGRLDTWLGG